MVFLLPGGGAPSQTAIDYKTTTMSVPDQYMARAGGNFSFGKFLASAGMRFECIPSSDLIGGDEGFRRPGYVVLCRARCELYIQKICCICYSARCY